MVNFISERHRGQKVHDKSSERSNERENISTDGESRFISSNIFRHIPRSELTVQLKLTRKIHGKWSQRGTASKPKKPRASQKASQRASQKALAPGTNIIKVSPTTSTIKQPGKLVVTVSNSYTAKV